MCPPGLCAAGGRARPTVCLGRSCVSIGSALLGRQDSGSAAKRFQLCSVLCSGRVKLGRGAWAGWEGGSEVRGCWSAIWAPLWSARTHVTTADISFDVNSVRRKDLSCSSSSALYGLLVECQSITGQGECGWRWRRQGLDPAHSRRLRLSRNVVDGTPLQCADVVSQAASSAAGERVVCRQLVGRRSSRCLAGEVRVRRVEVINPV